MFGSSTQQGRRDYQQDALCVGEELAPGFRLFGIYDGHGGPGGGRCSKLATTKLTEIVQEKIVAAIKENHASLEKMGELLSESFQEFDRHLLTLPRFEEKQPRRRSWKSILSGHRKSADFTESGSCACAVLSTPDGYVTANLGDSRAIYSNGARITVDHTCKSIKELERVYSQGGWVANSRVYGVLSPTRAFGDFKLKAPEMDRLPVSNTPDIFVMPKNEVTSRYIIVMCDGIHNGLTDSDIARICNKTDRWDVNDLAQCITDAAYEKGSKDNLSCIVIQTECLVTIPLVRRSTSIMSSEEKCEDKCEDCIGATPSTSPSNSDYEFDSSDDE